MLFRKTQGSRSLSSLLHLGRSIFSRGLLSQLYRVPFPLAAEALSKADPTQDEESKTGNNSKNEENSRRGRFAAFGAIPLLFLLSHPIASLKCYLFDDEKKTTLEKNKLTNRIIVSQYESNDPIEDRYHVQQLQSVEGYFLSVFDGHGGWQMAEYAKNNLGPTFEECLKENRSKTYANDDEYIIASLNLAFERVENSFLEIARNGYEHGYPQLARVGACAIVAVVHNDKLFIANLGDCGGTLLEQKAETDPLNPIKISRKFNANSKKEQNRLKAKWSTDKDIFHCKQSSSGGPGACYVKSMLQPTRAFGDFRLKHPEFNNPKKLEGYNRPIAQFEGPYIDHLPEIRTFKLDSTHKYLLLACDGLWDELKRADVARIMSQHGADKQKMATHLMDEALKHAADSHKMSVATMKEVPLGDRRKLHDDITFVIADLRNQTANN